MKKIKPIVVQKEMPNCCIDEVSHLIDMFVELCFEDIESAARITKFKLFGVQMGYSEILVDKVIKIGTSYLTEGYDEN
jgi:hypothetical protein